MSYEKTRLIDSFTIKNIVSVHYFEYAKNYVFEGEKHDFWEFLYVDKGEVEVIADTTGYNVKQGEIIFHKPNEFHNVWANGKVAPNLVVVSFECLSKPMDFFKNRILTLGDAEKNLLAQIIQEAKDTFSSPLNQPDLLKLEKRKSPLFGSEQMLKMSLSQLLIRLVRSGSSVKGEHRISKITKERSDQNMLKKVYEYLYAHVNSSISFTEICKFSGLGQTNLKILFKEQLGTGVMEYFKSMKIEEAKKMIRETGFNFTQISEKLGYSSIHYFSRHFKKATGMTPSQYALSILGISEEGNNPSF